MTLKEASVLAQNRTPVAFDGTKYDRITEVGMWFDKNGKRHDFVTLLDMNKNTAVRVQPERVKEWSEEE